MKALILTTGMIPRFTVQLAGLQRSGIDEAMACSSISKVGRGSDKLWHWCIISRMTRRGNAHDETKKKGVEEHPRDWGAHWAVVQKTLGFYTRGEGYTLD